MLILLHRSSSLSSRWTCTAFCNHWSESPLARRLELGPQATRRHQWIGRKGKGQQMRPVRLQGREGRRKRAAHVGAILRSTFCTVQRLRNSCSSLLPRSRSVPLSLYEDVESVTGAVSCAGHVGYFRYVDLSIRRWVKTCIEGTRRIRFELLLRAGAWPFSDKIQKGTLVGLPQQSTMPGNHQKIRTRIKLP